MNAQQFTQRMAPVVAAFSLAACASVAQTANKALDAGKDAWHAAAAKATAASHISQPVGGITPVCSDYDGKVMVVTTPRGNTVAGKVSATQRVARKGEATKSADGQTTYTDRSVSMLWAKTDVSGKKQRIYTAVSFFSENGKTGETAVDAASFISASTTINGQKMKGKKYALTANETQQIKTVVDVEARMAGAYINNEVKHGNQASRACTSKIYAQYGIAGFNR